MEMKALWTLLVSQLLALVGWHVTCRAKSSAEAGATFLSPMTDNSSAPRGVKREHTDGEASTSGVAATTTTTTTQSTQQGTWGRAQAEAEEEKKEEEELMEMKALWTLLLSQLLALVGWHATCRAKSIERRG